MTAVMQSVLAALLELLSKSLYRLLRPWQPCLVASVCAFIFYENQIRRLMNESPYDDRKLEVLRASCTSQPREMVNIFCVPMKNVSTSTRIEKALDRLRQRYGVSGGLTSEPIIIAIRNGLKLAKNVQ